MTDDELLRYSRQILLPDFDIAGQERLRWSRALIVGLGGLGSPVAMYLAVAGVGRLTLVDFDRVDLSNLQRQIVHRTADIGRLKVESARDTLLALNPSVAVMTLPQALDEAELREQVRQADVVVDACDNLPARLAINTACVRAGVPLVTGAAIRLEGQVLVWRPGGEGACYRCLYRDADVAPETCAQTGVLAPVVGIDLGRVDPETLDSIDMAQDLLDLGPAFDLQQNLATGTHEGQRLTGATRRDRAHNVDARNNGSVVIRRPADEAKHGAGTEEDDAAAAVEDLRSGLLAEPDPELDPLLHPGQFHARQRAAETGVERSVSGHAGDHKAGH